MSIPKRNSVLILLFILNVLSFNFIAFADTINVCALNDDGEIDYVLRSIAEDLNYQILIGDTIDSGTSNQVSGIDERCLGLVLQNYGANCQLETGELEDNRFYVSVGSSYYPQDSRCSYTNCVGNECAWFGASSSVDGSGNETGAETEEDSTSSIFIRTSDETTYENVSLDDIGLQPFDEVDRSVCETPNSPFNGIFMSKSMCENRDSDCAYDPYRVGVVTQLVGDSNSEGIFSSLSQDSMCVSKSTRIRSCEDIRSEQLCQNYQSLNPSENSLMKIYGCEWREVKSNIGICVTSGLYYENNLDRQSSSNSKIIDISNSLKRKNFFKNPLFEVNDATGQLYYWSGDIGGISFNSEYNNIFGTQRVLLNQGESISQLVSGIPFNVVLEIKVITTNNSDVIALVDSQRKLLSDSQPLFVKDNFISDLTIHSIEFTNDVQSANRNISIRANSQSEIFAVSLGLRNSDDSSTRQLLSSDIYPESMFEEGTFNCKLCSLGFNTGNCDKSKIDSLSNCELISTDSNSPYVSSAHTSSNPYTTFTGYENRFIEEDMTFCGLYSSQSMCENPDSKLNSVISAYHNSATLCKWKSDTTVPNGGYCYKDSLGDGVPDTVENGKISYLRNHVDSETYFSEYNLGEAGGSFNDFQYSCDVFPPSVVIEPYKKIFEDGELKTKRVNLVTVAEEGVVDFYYVRIENYVSPGCDVFENFDSEIILVLHKSDGTKIRTLASDFFSGYENQQIFFTNYSSQELENSLKNLLGSDSEVESFIDSGNIVAFDSSGNMQKNNINLSIGSTQDKLHLDYQVIPASSQEVYGFSRLNILDSEGKWDLLGNSCDAIIVDRDLGDQIVINRNISIETFLEGSYDVGSKIKNFESGRVAVEDDERDEFNVSVQLICRDVYGRTSLELKDFRFINSDGIILHSFDNGIFNSDNIPYLDINSKSMFLNISARDTVSCSNSYLSRNGDKIVDLGEITFADTSLVDEHPQRYAQEIDFTSYVSTDGIYEYVLQCNLAGEGFERVFKFEYNTQQPDLGDVKLVEKEDSKWSEFSGNVYIDAVDGNFMRADGVNVDTVSFNSYVSNNLKVLIEEESDISQVTLCNPTGVNILLENPIIGGNLLGDLESTGCEVQYIEEESLVELTSEIFLTNAVGNVNTGEITTYFDIKGPQINLETRTGGSTHGSTVYFNNNDPAFVIDLGLSSFREFTCSVDLIVNSNPFSNNFDSSNGQIQFKIDDITNQNVLSIPNVNLEMDITCQDSFFGREDTLRVSLEQDFDVPEIVDINFVNIGKNWGIPIEGNFFATTSDVEIILADTENYASCDYGIIDQNPTGVFEPNTINLKSIEGTNTNQLWTDNESIIKKQNQGVSSLAIVSNSPSSNKVEFSVRVDCEDGAGNLDSQIFDGYELNLFNYGEIQASGRGSEDNTLILEIRSLSSLEGLNINIFNGEENEIFHTGTIASLNPSFNQEGGVFIAELDTKLSLEELPSSPNYPFRVEITYGDNSFEDEFGILTDNEVPQITITDNSNDNDVVFGDILAGEIRIVDTPDFSSGLSVVEISLYKEGENVNSTRISQELTKEYRQSIRYEDLEPGIYRLDVIAKDKYGNENLQTIVYEMSDAFGVNILSSDNVRTQSLYPFVWFTQNEFPVLRFETAREVENCYLSPGENGGYIGSTYDFENTQGNIYELDTSTVGDFEIISGKNKVIIGCERPDRENEVDEVAVFLHYITGVPDYVLDISWGRTQFIPPGESEKLIDLRVLQKGQFREVSCNLEEVETGTIVDLEQIPMGEVASMSGNITLNEGIYTFELVCETPFGVRGPIKEYDIEVLREEFSINLEKLSKKITAENIDVDDKPLLLPRQLLESGNMTEFELEFTTNYQDDSLNCTIDTTSSGIVNFITSIFVNNQVEAYRYPQQRGLYGSDIEIDSSTNSIDISCSKGSEFNSRVFKFPIELFDSSTYQIEDIFIEGER